MKFISDLFGILLFFGAYSYTHDIFIATAVAMVATSGQVLYAWLRYHHVDNMQWVSLALIILFGGATLWLRNKQFIMWKPTVLYGLIATALFISERVGHNGIRAVLGAQIDLSEKVWRNLCYAWVVFFILMGILNLVVAYRFSEAIWVNFKLFGGLTLIAVFAIGQGVVLSRYVREK